MLAGKIAYFRPTGFDPRSISGLALWLDGADSSTLFQNSNGTTPATATGDPIGQWRDKSGNNRHVTQATAASRPTVSGTLQNGRRSLAFNGTSSGLSSNPYLAENGLAGLTRYAVLALSSGSPTIVARVFSGGGDIFLTTVSGEIRFGAGSAYSSVSSPTYGLLTSGVNIVGSVYDGTAANVATGIRPFYNGALLPASSTSGTLPATLPGGTPALWIGSNIGVNNFWPGRILEYITYSRALTTPERQRLERYLASKWGITLAPQVSNADAQSWINRVYANGGTVSTSTANAVDTFCNAIDSAGIRDRFYRLNLFAGTGLASALVPLYRGQSLGGTQFGNATDTNNNFVAGDYVETGSTGGLKGNGSSKYLATGFRAPAASLSASSFHLSCYVQGVEANGSARIFIGQSTNQAGLNLTASVGWVSGGSLSSGVVADIVFPNGGSTDRQGLLVAATNGSRTSTYYNNATSVVSQTSTSPDFETGAGDEFAVGARNFLGSPASYILNKRIRAYSLGAGMSASQVSAFNTALQAFQTALGRGVTLYSPPSYADSDVNTYISAVEMADDGLALESGVRDAINTFITGCKADGIWSAIKASCILCGARTLSGALVPLVGAAPTNFNFVAGDYNRKTGLVGNASTKYLVTNRAGNADPQNSNHIAVYASTAHSNAGNAGAYVTTGGIGGLAGASDIGRSGSNTANLFSRSRSSTSFAIDGAGAATGFIGLSRSASASYSRRANGTSGFASVTSETPASPNYHIFRFSDASGYCNGRLAFYSVGESLDLALLDTRITTLYNAIGAAIP
jgi:hypothetical protein